MKILAFQRAEPEEIFFVSFEDKLMVQRKRLECCVFNGIQINTYDFQTIELAVLKTNLSSG
jgi:hypothetical protein